MNLNPDQEQFFQLPLAKDSDHRPTHDSMVFAEAITKRWHSGVSPAAIQKLVMSYGPRRVEDKLRELYGFPPQDALRSAYAYLETMLKEGL